MTASVAELRYLTRATRNSTDSAQPDAQPATGQIARKSLSGAELRAQLRAQPERNQATQAVATDAPAVAHPQQDLSEAPMSPQCRKAVAMLEADPALTRAVVTDSASLPDTVILAVAIRGLAVGEILIPKDRYDGLAVLVMLERLATGVTTH